MSTRLTSAVVLGLAIIAGPMSGSAAWAQTPVATAASLQTVISGAARVAASDPTFAAKSPQQKLQAIQDAVAAALAEQNASEEVLAAALVQAVASGTISAGVAVQVAATVSPAAANTVLASSAVQTQLAASGQTITTAATSTEGAPSVLVTLTGAPATGGAPTTQPAAYDPCDGVVGDYCG
jgi:hypothetical protein